MTNSELRDRWATRRDEYQRLGVHVDGARVIDEFLNDLKSLQQRDSATALTLTQAAMESGYSADHLSLLIRTGKIQNAGRRGSPRILRQHLPKRPPRVLASGDRNTYDVAADVRSLRSRRHTGDNNGG